MVFHKAATLANSDRINRVTAKDLHEAHLGDVLRFVSSFIKPLAEAEDVTMEVFHAAFENLDKLKRSDSPRLWLLGIARRKVSDALRRRYRRPEAPIQSAHHLEHEPDIDREKLTMVNQTLMLLPEDQREALVLKYALELTTREVATILQRSEEATNSLLQRARSSFYDHGSSLFLNDPEVDHVQ